MFQPDYTDCANCGTVDHNDFDCPCGCHGDDAPSRTRQRKLATADKPLPPDVLASALQDRIAPASGKLLKQPSPVRASAQEIQAVRDDLARTKDVLGTLISWLAQSAGSPIRADEANTLIKRLV